MRFSLLPKFYCSYPHRIRPLFRSMSTEIPESKSPITAAEKVKKFQQVFHSNSTNSWDKCWEESLTPWDLGSPTPVLVHLNNTGSLPKGRALVPGCGSGYDVVAIAGAERYVVGLDVSDNAIKKAIELSSDSPNAEHFTFLKEDFFTWCPDQLFDLIFDYTFFCAIDPELRSLWARKMSDLLKVDGELITLMYPIDDHEGGPPYKVSVADYEEALHPVGFVATHISDNELAIAPRKVAFHALRFATPIQQVGNQIARRMWIEGPYITGLGCGLIYESSPLRSHFRFIPSAAGDRMSNNVAMSAKSGIRSYVIETNPHCPGLSSITDSGSFADISTSTSIRA